MAAETSQEANNSKNKEPLKITFTCWRCQKMKPLEEMKNITRFRPVLVVCQDCQKELR